MLSFWKCEPLTPAPISLGSSFPASQSLADPGQGPQEASASTQATPRPPCPVHHIHAFRSCVCTPTSDLLLALFFIIRALLASGNVLFRGERMRRSLNAKLAWGFCCVVLSFVCLVLFLHFSMCLLYYYSCRAWTGTQSFMKSRQFFSHWVASSPSPVHSFETWNILFFSRVKVFHHDSKALSEHHRSWLCGVFEASPLVKPFLSITEVGCMECSG